MALARYSIIVAVDAKNGIAKDGELPWDTSADLRFFKEITCKRVDSSHPQNVLIMGRKTFDSIPTPRRPLAGRINMVLSKKIQPSSNGQVIFHNSITDALKDPACVGAYNKGSTVFVMGGGEIYDTFLREYAYLCDKIIMTRFQNDYECDVFFPEISHLKLRGELLGNARVYTRHAYHFPLDDKKRGDHPENRYLDLVEEIYHTGYNFGTKRVLTSKLLRFDLSERFPLITTKLVNFDHVRREALWMLRGNTDSKLLEEQGITHHIPTSSKKVLEERCLPFNEGDLGPVAGWQLRRFGCPYKGADGTEKDGVVLDYLRDPLGFEGVDQWESLIKNIRDPSDPLHHTLTFWNPLDVKLCTASPDEVMMMFHVREDETVGATVVLRSCDMFSMAPYCVGYFAVIQYIVCFLTHLRPRDLNMMFGEVYIHQEHFEGVEKLIGRTPFPFPEVKFETAESINKVEEFLAENLVLDGYQHWPPIRVKARRS
jgi:thymidylate synthase